MSHCFSLGGGINPSAQWCLGAVSPYRAHLFLRSCFQQDQPLRNRRFWERFDFYVSTHCSHSLWRSGLPLCGLTGRGNIPEHLGRIWRAVHWQASWSKWKMTTGLNFIDQIKCLLYNPQSLGFLCCSWKQLIQEIVQLGHQWEGGADFWFCKQASCFIHKVEKVTFLNSKESRCYGEFK